MNRRGALLAVALMLVAFPAVQVRLALAADPAQRAGHRRENHSRTLVRGELFEQPLGDGLGTNHRLLEGWHFRNQANTGPNEGDVNAPQREREFDFVLTPADYEQASQAVDTLVAGAQVWFETLQFDAELCRGP